MSITLYGIKNCDTIKKAKKWLDVHKIDYQFHDHRIDGLNKSDLQTWCKKLDWQLVLNKRGTSFRLLDEAQKQSLDEEKAILLMLETPAMIKRPLLQVDNELYLGFKPELYSTIFNK